MLTKITKFVDKWITIVYLFAVGIALIVNAITPFLGKSEFFHIMFGLFGVVTIKLVNRESGNVNE